MGRECGLVGYPLHEWLRPPLVPKAACRYQRGQRLAIAFGVSGLPAFLNGLLLCGFRSPQVTAMSGPFGGWSVSVSSFAPWGKATTFVRSAQRGGKG